jgi:acyl-CoA thioesterase-1
MIIFLGMLYFLFFRNLSPQGTPNQVINSGIIVTFGDSLTVEHGVDERVNYPSQLQEELHQFRYSNYQIVNLGMSGDTTKDGLKRVDTIFQHTPEIVIVAFGANDAFQRVPLEKTKNNLTEMLERIRQHDAVILLAGIVPPPTRGIGYISDFENMYQQLATQFDAVLMPSFLSGVMMRSKYNLSDNIHPHQFGYTVIVRNVDSTYFPSLYKRIEEEERYSTNLHSEQWGGYV